MPVFDFYNNPDIDPITGQRKTFTLPPLGGNGAGPSLQGDFTVDISNPDALPKLPPSPPPTAYDSYQRLLSEPPERPKTSIWRGILGGLAGAFLHDPNLVSSITQPGYQRDMQDWQTRLGVTKAALDAENAKRKIDIENAKEQATTNHYNAMTDWYKGQLQDKQEDNYRQRLQTVFGTGPNGLAGQAMPPALALPTLGGATPQPPDSSFGPQRTPQMQDEEAVRNLGLPGLQRGAALAGGFSSRQMVPASWSVMHLPGFPGSKDPGMDVALPSGQDKLAMEAAIKKGAVPALADYMAQADAIAPPSIKENAALNARLKSQLQFYFSNGDVKGAQDALKQASQEVRQLEVATDPRVGNNKVSIAVSTANALADAKDARKPTYAPETVSYWADQVRRDANNMTLIQGDKDLAKAVRDNLAAGGADLSKIDAQSKATAKFAQTVLPHIVTTKAILARLAQAGEVGNLVSRWNDFKTGTYGKGGDFAALRDNIALINTAMGRAHGGARGGGSPIMLEHFKSLLNARIMDEQTLKTGLDTFEDYLKTYAAMDDNRKVAGAQPEQAPVATAPATATTNTLLPALDADSMYVFKGGKPHIIWKKDLQSMLSQGYTQ